MLNILALSSWWDLDELLAGDTITAFHQGTKIIALGTGTVVDLSLSNYHGAAVSLFPETSLAASTCHVAVRDLAAKEVPLVGTGSHCVNVELITYSGARVSLMRVTAPLGLRTSAHQIAMHVRAVTGRSIADAARWDAEMGF